MGKSCTDFVGAEIGLLHLRPFMTAVSSPHYGDASSLPNVARCP